MRKHTLILAAIAVAAGCTKTGTMASSGATPGHAHTAIARIADNAGHQVGTLTFADAANGSGVIVSGTLSGLGLGEHGIHIHTVGKCEGPDFASAGGHFNPTARKHGLLNPAGPHMGDMPNFVGPAAGSGSFAALLPGVSLTGTHALLDADGSAVVVHASKDDYTTDPSGNSGGRIACGVITAS